MEWHWRSKKIQKNIKTHKKLPRILEDTHKECIYPICSPLAPIPVTNRSHDRSKKSGTEIGRVLKPPRSLWGGGNGVFSEKNEKKILTISADPSWLVMVSYTFLGWKNEIPKFSSPPDQNSSIFEAQTWSKSSKNQANLVPQAMFEAKWGVKNFDYAIKWAISIPF